MHRRGNNFYSDHREAPPAQLEAIKERYGKFGHVQDLFEHIAALEDAINDLIDELEDDGSDDGSSYGYVDEIADWPIDSDIQMTWKGQPVFHTSEATPVYFDDPDDTDPIEWTLETSVMGEYNENGIIPESVVKVDWKDEPKVFDMNGNVPGDPITNGGSATYEAHPSITGSFGAAFVSVKNSWPTSEEVRDYFKSLPSPKNNEEDDE